jgi:hypothetical protein
VAVAAVLILPTTSAIATSINIVNDTKVVGTDYILQSFDSGSLPLTGRNDKGTFSATIDFSKTVFRDAKLDKYIPNDPYREACYNLAIAYNGVSTSDGMNGTLGNMATTHCDAKVLVDSKSGIV